MRILCVIPAMGPGGAERAMARLITALAPRHSILLMTWEAKDAAPFFPLPPSIAYERADLLGGKGLNRFFRLLSRLSRLRRQIQAFAPDVVLSFMDTTNVVTLVACLGCGRPVVVSERTDPSRHYIPRTKSILRTLAYGLADRIIVQTERVRRFFPERLQDRIAIIPNPAPRPADMALPGEPDVAGRFRIIGLGRLGREKGFDRLISAFAEVATHHPLWDLTIFGEGDERPALEAQATTSGFGGRIHLPGLTRTPEAELLVSHIMVVPSRYEGFPNALAEGIATGLPTIAFAETSGVEELVIPGETGFLIDPAEDTAGLAVALNRLMSDAELRVRMGAAGRNHALRWTPERIHDRWETLLDEVAHHARQPSHRNGNSSCAE